MAASAVLVSAYIAAVDRVPKVIHIDLQCFEDSEHKAVLERISQMLTKLVKAHQQ